MKLVKEHINEVIKHLSPRNEEELFNNFLNIGDLVKKLRQIAPTVKCDFENNIPFGSTVIIDFDYNNDKFKIYDSNNEYWRLFKWYDVRYKRDYREGYDEELDFNTFEELYEFLQQDE